MKTLFLFISLLGLSYAQHSEPEALEPGAFKVYIDGNEVAAQDQYVFNRDETYELRVEGLKPASQVNLVYKKAAIKWAEYKYMVPENGRVRKILEAPNKPIGLTCIVQFTTTDGKRHELSFKLKFRNLDKKK